jgi:hypothetical protein
MTQSISLKHSLAFFNYMPVSVAHFVSLEVLNLIEMPSRLGFVAPIWQRTVIAVLRV